MNKDHEALVDKAKDAISKVFSDTEVSQSQTLESLAELAGDIRMYENAIKADIANAENE